MEQKKVEYLKTIICLADSRKTSGRCVAGKDIDGNWLRPVSNTLHGELSETDRRFQDGTFPQLLDKLSIAMLRPAPHDYQIENHLIDDHFYWVKAGSINFNDLSRLVDHPTDIFLDGHSSSNGENDRVPLNLANNLNKSLILIKPSRSSLTISIAIEGANFNNGKRKVRANFTYNNKRYKIAITDPLIERKYLSLNDGIYKVEEDAYMCISLGEPFGEYTYKLVASVIPMVR
jgi:hypothetical protein